jgi:hypothetical protein
LQAACRLGHEELVRHAANRHPNSQNKDIALQVGSYWDCEYLFRVLLEYGAEIKAAPDSNCVPLQVVRVKSRIERVVVE